MRKFVKRCWLLVLVMSFMAAISVHASASDYRSSYVITRYTANLTSVGNQVLVHANVYTLGVMQQVGVSKILIYDATNSSPNVVGVYKYTEYPSMMGSGSKYTGVAITHNGIKGHKYYAVVHCYAANPSVSDTKVYQTSTITL